MTDAEQVANMVSESIKNIISVKVDDVLIAKMKSLIRQQLERVCKNEVSKIELETWSKGDQIIISPMNIFTALLLHGIYEPDSIEETTYMVPFDVPYVGGYTFEAKPEGVFYRPAQCTEISHMNFKIKKGEPL